MPILTPFEAYYLCGRDFCISKYYNLFTTFLPIASKNIFLNKKTFQVYDQFSKLLVSNYNTLNEYFSLDIPDLSSISVDNYYDFFLKIIQTQYEKDSKDGLLNLKNEIDVLNVPLSCSEFTICISSLSYAVISLRTNYKQKKSIILDMIILILAASGFVLTLTVSSTLNFSVVKSLIKTTLFSECHLFRESDEDFNINFLQKITDTYIYLYAFRCENVDTSEINNPYVQFFFISEIIEEVFEPALSCSYQKDFEEYPLDKDRFKIGIIAIAVYNNQEFISYDLQKCWIPNNISKYKHVFICASDFMNWYGQRIMYFTDLTSEKIRGFLDFNEMHYLKIDHHITNPLYTMKVDYFSVKLINDIIKHVTNSPKIFNATKSKFSDVEKFVEEKIHYAFHKIYKHWHSYGSPVIAYPTQVFAVNHAIDYLAYYHDDDPDGDNRGCIYQVRTGEGKSIIICALAEIFARMGKTVHIVTSNIVLACRDYENSFDYFNKCKFRSAILLHETELKSVKCDEMNKYYPSSDPKDYYHESWFKNSACMNMKVCEKGTLLHKSCEIVFSTFFNFEGWYLRENEEHPFRLNEYMKNCFLIIDESDTILIDELTNGTIIAREMKSNGIKVLEKVYELNERGIRPQGILDEVNNIWPECDDIKLDNIESMIRDIKTAKSFEENSKYIIQNDNGEDNIVPFDSEHKGITEKEKEFSGFIHQFIGIKERKKHPEKNIVIKPLSLNYMFISHPIFVRQYQCIWGFTGTIGTEKDKEILKTHYHLDTYEIPHHSTNYRKDLPTVICKDITERNQRILEEINIFIHKSCPVLVIFERIDEIKDMKKLVINKFTNPILLTFDGTELDKENIEKNSGKKRTITLGTNFCGRGTNIDYSDEFPLHVIIAYGPRNVRALGQAYGRTGRNGKSGTTRIICTKKAFHKVSKVPNENLVNKVLSEYELKKQRLNLFVEKYKFERPWIFNTSVIKDWIRPFYSQEYEELRDSVINVNRLTAINYEFPICMSYKTFHKIQCQKIFSIVNCPECIYTWILFQRYLRELILQTWSIFIDKVTRDYEKMQEDNEKMNFHDFFEIQYLMLESKMDKIIPLITYDYSVNETFLRIHGKVTKKWKDRIMLSFPKTISNFRKVSDTSKYLGYKTGFFPYELKDKSGARICFDYEDEESYTKSKRKGSYIEDPELIYLRKGHHFSITQVIDDIFEEICAKIDETLSSYLGIHFYVRRTLAGCEFGICIDPVFMDIKVDKYHCLCDKTPLLLCTIMCKSMRPFIAAILLIILVFATIIAVKIAKYIASPGFGIKDALKKIRKWIWNTVKKKIRKKIVDTIAPVFSSKKNPLKLIKWLQDQIYSQVSSKDDPIIIVMNSVLGILDPDRYNGDKQYSTDYTTKIEVNPDAEELFKNMKSSVLLVRIAVLVVLLIAAFIKNFQPKKALATTAAAYQSECIKNKKKMDSDFYLNYAFAKNFDEYKTVKNVKDDVESSICISKIDSDDEDSSDSSSF